MTNDTLIISLTSYPQRIHCVKRVLKSLVNQTADRSLYHIVLVLAIPQFPNKEKDLPQDLVDYIQQQNIEIIWYERDIRSHKKYIPTVKKYPNNPILITDDDVTRQDWWVQMFLDDYKKYPNDIIGGLFVWKTDKRFKQIAINGNVRNWQPYSKPNGIITCERYANGLGGTLFPPHTFTDERFFDEDLIMKLSPTSDESWDYCFNIMEGKVIRQASRIYNYTLDEIKDVQSAPTALHNINNFTTIYQRLTNYFPKYKEELFKRIENNGKQD